MIPKPNDAWYVLDNNFCRDELRLVLTIAGKEMDFLAIDETTIDVGNNLLVLTTPVLNYELGT